MIRFKLTAALAALLLTASLARALPVGTTDLAGNPLGDLPFTAGDTYILDATPPDAPTGLDLDEATDSGLSNSDNLTNDTTPTINGAGEVGATVTLYDTDGTTSRGSTVVGESGTWSITTSAMGAGEHTLTAKQSDQAGNVSDASDGLAIVIDISAPAATGSVRASANPTNASSVQFTVTFNEGVTGVDTSDFSLASTGSVTEASITSISGSNKTYTVTADTGVGSGTLKLDVLSDHSIIDAAGNATASGFTSGESYTIDKTAPSASSITRATGTAINSGVSDLTFRVAFDEDVTGVDIADFTLDSSNGNATGTLAFLTAVSASEYDVVVNAVSGLGQLSVSLNSSGTSIIDTAGNAVSGGYAAGDFYLAGTDNVFETTIVPGAVGQLVGFDMAVAQPFTTSANGPMTAYHIAAQIGGVDEGSPVVTIHEDDQGQPGGIVATLRNPTTLQANRLNVWTTATALDAETRYWLVFSHDSGSSPDGFYVVVATGLEDGGAGSWIESGSYQHAEFLDLWEPTSGALRIAMGAVASPGISSIAVPTNGSYRSGQDLEFTVNYGAAVTVDITNGTLRLPLTIGETTVYATYQSGSESSALVFRYTVQAGDNDADGIAVTSPVDLHDGTIKGAADVDALLTFPPVDTTGILVDNTAPAVASVAVPSGATYVADQNLDFTVNFSENVVVDTADGRPRIALTIGSSNAYATYVSGSGTTAAVFRYTVQVNDLGAAGVEAGALDLDGGTLRDSAGNDAVLTLNSVGETTDVRIDAVAPTIASVTAPTGGYYRAGQTLSFTVNLSENVTVDIGNDTPRIVLTVGETTRYANYAAGTGTTALVFSYTVQMGETDDDGIEVAAAVDLNGGTLRDVAGNNAALSFSAPALSAVRVDTTAPVALIGAPSTSLTRGGPVTYAVTYGDAHFSGSTLSLADVTLNVSGTASGTVDVSGSGAARTVSISSITGDGTLGISIAGSTASDEAGNVAGAAGPSALIAVDNTAPTIAEVSIGSNNTDASLAKAGDLVSIIFVTSETIATPTVTIAGHAATVEHRTDLNANAWSASYTMTADETAGAVAFSIAFSDLAGNAGVAVTTVTDDTSVTFDPTAPTLTAVAIASNNPTAGWAKVDDDVTVSFTASEAIATPTVTIGGRAATVANGNGNDWTASITMAGGDTEGAIAFSIAFADVTGNAGTSVTAVTDDSGVGFDRNGPTTTVSAPSVMRTRGGPVTFTVTYADDGFDTSTLAAGDVTLDTTGSADAQVEVTGEGETRTITLSEIVGNGTLGVTIAGETATDVAGNLASASDASATVIIDNTAPEIVSIERYDPITINSDATSLTWRVMFDDDVTGVDANDFVLSVQGSVTGTIGAVTPFSASVYDVTIDSVAGLGLLRLDVAPSATGIEDLAENAIVDGGFTGEFYIAGVTSVFQSTHSEVDGSVEVGGNAGLKVAQRFTTAAGEPLTLTTVAAAIGAITGAPEPLVTVHLDDDGVIGEHVATLQTTDRLVANALNLWVSTQPLEANRTYWVVFDATSNDGTYEVLRTTDSDEMAFGTWLGGLDRVFGSGLDASNRTNGLLSIAIGATSVPTITSTLTAGGVYGSAFDDYTITATNLPTSFSATGLPTGLSLDEATGVISGTPTQSGTFNVALSATNISGEGAPSTLVLEIAKAPLTVTANPASRIYGAANPAFTVSYNGFVNSDTDAALTTLPTAATTAIPTSPVDEYDIVPSGGSAANYTLNYANGTLTVTKATATITFDSLSRSYTGGAQTATVTTNPTGLTVDVTYDGGAMAPSAPGSYAVLATIVDSNYQGTASGTLSIGKSPVAITLGGLEAVYDGTPKAVTATAAGGLSVAITYNGSSDAPVNAGEYAVAASVNTATQAGNAAGTLKIAKAAQTIAFVLAELNLGSVNLAATASSGLPVTFAVVSGPATVIGAKLTVTGSGSVRVRASQAGNVNFEPAMVEHTVAVSGKLAQTIIFPTIAERTTLDGAFRLVATASSGLPAKFTVVSGPAMVAGRSLILDGTPGTVVVRASQAGNDVYGAAVDVEQSFEIRDATTATFFGDLTSGASGAGRITPRSVSTDGERLIAPKATKVGDIGASFTPGVGSGTLMIVAGSIGLNVVLDFSLNEDGSYTISFSNAGESLTVNGALVGDTLNGHIPELDLSFSTQTAFVGSTAAFAGFYQSEALETAQGVTYSIVGSDGQALVLVITPTVVTGGMTSVADDGSFALTTSEATVTGAINAPSSTVSGAIAIPGQPQVGFSGLRDLVRRTDRLINLSSRARVGAGDRTLITGFVIGGDEPKEVLLRAAGPSLNGTGLVNPLSNPRLYLFNGQGELLAQNDDWSGSDVVEATLRVGAFAFPEGSQDAAFVTSLEPGVYTMHVSGGEESGVAVAEVYDASENPEGEYQRLINISSRGDVGTGDNVLIGGFVVTGNSPKRVLVRGVGPALTAANVSGALADPVVRVFQGSIVIGENDDWTSDPVAAAAVVEATTITGAGQLLDGSKDAAMILTLAPGVYTVHVSGSAGTTGVGLVEVYEIPE